MRRRLLSLRVGNTNRSRCERAGWARRWRKRVATQSPPRITLTPDPTKNGRDYFSTSGASDGLTPDGARRNQENPGPLRAAHTPNFPALLRNLGASLLVTTYQASKLVMVRDEGDHLNTHYRT